MFGPLGFPEMLFIVVLALLIFGPKRLPEVGRTIGKGMAQFRKATSDLKRTIETEIALESQENRTPLRSTPAAVQPRQPPTPPTPLITPGSAAARASASERGAESAPASDVTAVSGPEGSVIDSPTGEPPPGTSRPN
jgi:TatA/E family protein of Tat protein translocase